jgi:hypothetical protein
MDGMSPSTTLHALSLFDTRRRLREPSRLQARFAVSLPGRRRA